MVQIIQDLIPKGRRNRPGYRLDPKYITIHDTANTQSGADAKAHASYVKSAAAAAIPVSWHYTVDDKVIYQHLPLNENGWHAGDGANGTGNRQSIGIEICENRDGNRAAAEANAAWLVAKLLREFNLGLDRVKQHYDWSGKNCPAQIRGRKNGWANFLKAVETHLKVAEPPKIDRVIDLYYDGKKLDDVGHYIAGKTRIDISFAAKDAGWQLEPKGDRINIISSKKTDQAEIEKLKAEINKLKSDLTAERKKIENAIKALS